MQDPGKDLPVIVLIAARGDGQNLKRLKLTFWTRVGGETSFFIPYKTNGKCGRYQADGIDADLLRTWLAWLAGIADITTFSAIGFVR